MKHILKTTVKSAIKKALAALAGAEENFTSAIVTLAKKEVEGGADAGAVVLAILATETKGSWGAQALSKALKSDADLLKAGLAVKAFRNSKPAPAKGNRKPRKAGKAGPQREGDLTRALRERNAEAFAAALISAFKGNRDALAEFVDEVTSKLA